MGSSEFSQENPLDALPAACRTGCSIAKFAINELVTNEERLDIDADAFVECADGPKIVGQCGTEKTKCSHPSTGSSDDFHEQVFGMTEYLRRT